MKTAQKKRDRRSTGSSLSSKALEIRVIGKDEKDRFDSLLGEHHYLGEGRPAGDTMRMVTVVEGEWVGLLMWAAAAYCLKPRDEYIGWTPQQRAARQKLVVQNRRFALLAERGEHPNLASRILGAAVRELPGLWQEAFGYQPLLAETFTDIEAYEGTCYKASGWEPLGLSKGNSRHRADFYVPNDRPKKLWVRPLRPDATAQLRAPQVPSECAAGAHSDADGVLPLKKAQIESLYDALCRVPDPRASNRTFSIGSILTLVAMGIFSGYYNLAQIVRFANRLTMDQRYALALPRFSSQGMYRKVPSYKVFYNLLRKLDVDAFAACLSNWLAQHNGSLPCALALDGKFIRDTVGIVCLVDHETGVAHAMARASQEEGEGEYCELKVGQWSTEQHEDLSHALITADAVHCQTHTAQQIVARGGDFVLQVKANQKTVQNNAVTLTAELSPLLSAPKRPTDA